MEALTDYGHGNVTARNYVSLKISAINVTKSAVSEDLVTFTKKIFVGKLHLCTVCVAAADLGHFQGRISIFLTSSEDNQNKYIIKYRNYFLKKCRACSPK